jgi:hypothetical protein
MVDIPTHVAAVFNRLGEPVEYLSPVQGRRLSITAIVRLRPASPDIGYEVGGEKPTVDVLLRDVPDPQAGDSIVIRGLEYSVLSPEKDEVRGTALLHIRKLP